jgi:hypothetical protein
MALRGITLCAQNHSHNHIKVQECCEENWHKELATSNGKISTHCFQKALNLDEACDDLILGLEISIQIEKPKPQADKESKAAPIVDAVHQRALRHIPETVPPSDVDSRGPPIARSLRSTVLLI